VLERSIDKQGNIRWTARVSSTSRRADEDSRGSGAQNPVEDPEATGDGAGRDTVTTALLAMIAAGIAALIAATFLPVLRISVDERVITALDRTGWDQHGAALLALAAFAAFMLVALVRGDGGRAAAVAIALCGAVAIVIVVATDLPDVGDVGSVGERLRTGEVGTGLGAYAEALGGVLLLAGGGGLALRARGDD
jgi:hypothetical protein